MKQTDLEYFHPFVGNLLGPTYGYLLHTLWFPEVYHIERGAEV